MRFRTALLLIAFLATSGAGVSAPTATDLVPLRTLGDLAAPMPEGVHLTLDHKGRAGKAFAFSGEPSGLDCAVDISPTAMPVCTLVTWARSTGDPEEFQYQQVVSGDDGNYDRSIGLDERAGAYGWSCFAGNQGVIGGFPREPGRWVFLAAVYDDTSKRVTFYANGARAEAAEAEFDHASGQTSLGRNPTYGEHFVGDIEPVKVYDRALTEDELDRLRQQ